MSTIKTKNSTSPSAVPSAASLSQGELAVNIADKKLFVGNASGDPVELTNQGVLSINGSTGAITNVAFTNIPQTFSGLQTFSTGISAAGGTFGTLATTSFVLSDQLTIGSQVIYAQGTNGFSVNEDFDPSNSSDQTAYHYTSGAGRSELAFTLARTAQFTNGFGIYGDSSNNKFVCFGEASNTNWEWRTGVGIRPLDLDGGTLRMSLSNTGALRLNDAFTFPTSDGSANQVLTTNGSGTVSFQDIPTPTNVVTSVNGATGAITNVAFTNVDNNFSVGQTFDQGFTVTSNAAATINQQVLATYTSNVVDVVATVDGVGLRVAKGTAGKNSGVGSIAIGRSATTTNNTLLSNDDGTFTIANGTVGSNTPIVEFSSSQTDFSVDVFAPNIVNSVNGATGDVIVSAIGFTFASSAPSSPAVGDRWMDADTGKEYVYINDGDSSQWIQPVASNGLVGVTYDNGTSTYHVDASVEITGTVTSDDGYRIGSGAINSQIGSTYALVASDNGKIIVWNYASGATLTVPSGLAVGFNATVIQTGTGSIGITGSGTTLNSFEGKLNIAGQHAAVSIISYSSNVFNIAGGLTG